MLLHMTREEEFEVILKIFKVKNKNELEVFLHNSIKPLRFLNETVPFLVPKDIVSLDEISKQAHSLRTTLEHISEFTSELNRPKKSPHIKPRPFSHIILIDDDEFNGFSWSRKAKSNGIVFTHYRTEEDFRKALPSISKNTMICLDWHLSNHKTSENLIYFLKKIGFKKEHIYITTDSLNFDSSKYPVQGLVSKTPNWMGSN